MSAPISPPFDPRRAALLMLASALAFSLMSVAVKFASGSLPSTMIVFFRNAVALFLLLPWAARGGRAALETHRFTGHLVRGLAGLSGMVCFFFAIAHLRLADAVLLNYSFPLFMPLAERFWLREPAPRGTWPRLLIGFAGVIIILKPGSDLFSRFALLGLMSGLFVAVAQVGIRRLTHTEPIPRIVFYFALIATSVSALWLPFTWESPTVSGWLALAAIGSFATIGQFALTRSYFFAPPTVVGPLIYFTVVFSVLLDWGVWRILPDGLFVAGAALVAAAGASLLRHHQATGDPESSSPA
ncbi:MAG: DMT family transporter [Vicinamibacterales bacterium]